MHELIPRTKNLQHGPKSEYSRRKPVQQPEFIIRPIKPQRRLQQQRVNQGNRKQDRPGSQTGRKVRQYRCQNTRNANHDA